MFRVGLLLSGLIILGCESEIQVKKKIPNQSTRNFQGVSALGGGAVYGRSDSCNSNQLIAIVDRSTDCNSLGPHTAWSIMVNGQCIDIQDTTAPIACSMANGGGAVFGRSDSCNANQLIQTVHRRTNCNQLGSASAWSIIVDGQCKNIQDTTAELACSQASGGAAIFGRSDSCNAGQLIATVNGRTDCNQFSSQAAWSIMVKGECRDITDTTAQLACAQATGSDLGDGTTGSAVFGRSDSCSSNQLITVVNRRTDCKKLGSQPAWSVLKNGVCEDISDTRADIACSIAKGRRAGAVFGRSDSCNSNQLISVVDRKTDCKALGRTAAWSIIVNGKCVDVSDTFASVACANAVGGGAVYGRSDSCSASQLIEVVDRKTNCESFGNQAAWSIMKNGQCIDISDTKAKIACSQLK